MQDRKIVAQDGAIDVDALAWRRAALGMSVVELAEKAGVSRSTLSYIHARHHTPRPATVGKIAIALGCTIADITIRTQRDSDAA